MGAPPGSRADTTADTLMVSISGEVSIDGAASSLAASSFTPGSTGPQRLAGRYEILGLLGAGGMGTVYRARDLELDEVVALKVLRKEVAADAGVLERFRREAKLARRVTHHNVARVYDIGEHEGEKFLTMEFVDGEPLSALLAREGALAVPRAVEIAAAIAQALGGAHAAGVVHRDLKPDNVMIGKDGRVVVTDFGIARASLDGAPGASSTIGLLLGTPAYMAPEQVEGKADIDARADLYAFGGVLFELLTGQRAWPGDSPYSVAAARLYNPPPDPRAHKPDLPTACAELVLRCLARSPADRPANIAAVAAELAKITLPTPAAPATVAAALPALPEAKPGDKTVAVLPFRNAGAPEDDYLAEELTDDLIDSLSMTRGLKVRSRGAVQKYRGAERDPRDVGRELGVQVVVEGSVRRARGNVRISARLIGVADGFQLWAKRFDRPEQDVLSVNDEAASAIAGALTLDHAGAAREAPSNPAAIDLYLRARHEYRKFFDQHQRKAIALFEQAALLAPADPTILSGMAMAYARLSFFDGNTKIDRAKEVAERAVAVAPSLGEPHLALGSVLFQVGDVVAAVTAFKQAIARSPGLAEAHAALGRILAEAGALDDGVRRCEAALDLDAEVPLAASVLGRSFALLGDWDRSARIYEKLRAHEGQFVYWSTRARMALWRNDRGSAETFLREVPLDQHLLGLPKIVAEIARTRTLPSERPDFAKLAEATEGGWRRRVFFLQIHVEMLSFLDARDESLKGLRAAADLGLLDLAWLERCPLLESLRAAPEFAPIHAQVKARVDEILAAARS